MSHVQEYKILTIRNANDHADLLNKARKEFNETYANNALIKAGYECFRYKELYEKERQELLLLKRKLESLQSVSSTYIKALKGLEAAVN